MDIFPNRYCLTLLTGISKTITFLKKLNIEKADKIVLFGENSIEFIILLFAAAFILIFIFSGNPFGTPTNEITYSEFLTLVENNKVNEVVIVGRWINAKIYVNGKYECLKHIFLMRIRSLFLF